VIRLARIATDNWAEIDGFAASQNMPPLEEMQVDRFTNFVWWWATRNISDQAALLKFKADIWRPLPGQEAAPDSPWHPANETKALESFRSALGR